MADMTTFKNIVFTFLCLFVICNVWAQVPDDYKQGYLILNNGDTASALIEVEDQERIERSIKVWRMEENGRDYVSADDLKGFILNGETFLSRPFEDDIVYMKVIVYGEAKLFFYKYSDRGKTKSVWFMQIGQQPLVEVTKRNFRGEAAWLFRDNKKLASDIQNKYYTFKTKAAAVEEYNFWVEQGRPDSEWTEENGNYAYDHSKEKLAAPKGYSYAKSGPRIGIEVFGFANYTFLNYSNLLNQVIRTRPSGIGFGTGAGVWYMLSNHFSVHGGIKFWNKRFESEYLVIDQDSNVYSAAEEGKITYFGLYAKIYYTTHNFIIGAGFEGSYYKLYSGDLRITDNGGNVVEETNNANESILTGGENFKNQFDFTIILGYSINLFDKRLKIQPTFTYAIPFVSLWNSGQFSTSSGGGLTELNINGYNLQFGINLAYGFN